MATKTKTPNAEVHGTPNAPSRRSEPPARVQAWQVQAFYNLLCDVGLDEFVQKSIELKRHTNTRAPVTADAQTGSADASEEEGEDLVFDLDMPRIFRVLGQEGRLIELLGIVMGIRDDQEAMEQIDVEEASDFFTVFMAASLRPIGMLAGFGRGMV